MQNVGFLMTWLILFKVVQICLNSNVVFVLSSKIVVMTLSLVFCSVGQCGVGHCSSSGSLVI